MKTLKIVRQMDRDERTLSKRDEYICAAFGVFSVSARIEHHRYYWGRKARIRRESPADSFVQSRIRADIRTLLHIDRAGTRHQSNNRR